MFGSEYNARCQEIKEEERAKEKAEREKRRLETGGVTKQRYLEVGEAVCDGMARKGKTPGGHHKKGRKRQLLALLHQFVECPPTAE